MSVNRDYEEVISEIQHYQEEWCNGEKLGAVDALKFENLILSSKRNDNKHSTSDHTVLHNKRVFLEEPLGKLVLMTLSPIERKATWRVELTKIDTIESGNNSMRRRQISAAENEALDTTELHEVNHWIRTNWAKDAMHQRRQATSSPHLTSKRSASRK
ncbi:hypothetical protein C8R41DRAFT_869882 [Lentinula lateritia]|uniref:Uncharacterized protein n=1 Tax=Lentinula lateritia TaxID=40482 RepID=A0ABQ8V7Z3_9AGAR|nr:hypothetical protein C8R41DRAFT_869882 [Lentinula lateritia]